MKDWRGVEIKIGSRVIYAFNTSTSVIHIAEGTVLEFPPLVGRQRLQRATVAVVRSTGSGVAAGWSPQAVKVNRLTVLEHDAS